MFYFNDALNTFYLQLYGIRHMVKDHSNSEKGFFYMHHPTDRITHTTAFVTPVMEHWLEREIAHFQTNVLNIFCVPYKNLTSSIEYKLKHTLTQPYQSANDIPY